MNPELRKYLESLGMVNTVTDDEAGVYYQSLDGDGKVAAEKLFTEPDPASDVNISDADLDNLAAPFLKQMQSVNETIAAVKDTVTEMKGRVDEMGEQIRKPAHANAQQAFFGSHIRIGEDPLGSRGFSFGRAAARAQGFIEEGDCKFERALSDSLYAYYQQAGQGLFAGQTSAQGIKPFCVPLGTDMIPDEAFDKTEYTRQELGMMIQQGLTGSSPDETMRIAQSAGYSRNQVRQALSIYDDASMGTFTEMGPKGEMIDLLRNSEVVSRVGATNITLPANGYLPFPKQTSAATGYWVGEAESITTSEPGTGRLELRAKKAAALVTLPNELLRFGTPSAEAFVRSDMASVLSLLVDLAALEGAGTSTVPLGVLNHAGITTHTTTLGTNANGNVFEPDTPNGMISDVEELNHDPSRDGFAYVMRPAMWQNLISRRADTIASGDQNGTFLFAVNREDITRGMPTSLNGYPIVRSTQVSNTRSKGTASNLSYVIGGVWKHMLIGRIGVLEFAVATQGDTTFNQDQTKLRAIQFIDIGLRYENAFVIADNIDMDLPGSP